MNSECNNDQFVAVMPGLLEKKKQELQSTDCEGHVEKYLPDPDDNILKIVSETHKKK